MAGPKQPIDLLKVKGRAHLTKSEIKEREQQEIHAPADKIEPPGYLTKKQKSEFNKISSQLIELGIMSNLDCDCLARYIIAEENYRNAVRMMKKLPCDPELIVLIDKVTAVQDRAFKQCRAAASDLGLTISSRCKLVVPKAPEKPKSKWDQYKNGTSNG